MDEHTVSALSALTGVRQRILELKTKDEVQQLLCRLKRDLSEQDYNTVINFVNFQNGVIVNMDGELATRRALITSLEEQIEELKKNANDPED